MSRSRDILEKQVKERVKRTLRNHNAWWHMPVQRGHGAPGLDFHVCHRGQFAGVETKRPGKHPTPRQELTMENIASAGGRVFVVGEAYDEQNGKFTGEEELLTWLLRP